MSDRWLGDVSSTTKRWALAVPLVVGTFCLIALETYERGAFELVGVPYQAALMAALLFVPGVTLVQFVHTKLCWALTVFVLSAAPVIGLVRTIEAAGTGIDAFLPYLMTVLVLGISAAIVAVGSDIVLRPDDHLLVRRLARGVVGAPRPAGAAGGFWRVED